MRRLQTEFTRSRIDMSGAWLSLAELDSAWGELDATFELDRANLEFTRLPDTAKLLNLDKALLSKTPNETVPPDIRLTSPEVQRAKKFCEDEHLFEGDRFDPEFTNPFILVPGGVYRIASHHESGVPQTVEVLAPTFLIQKYPVSNGQFLRFMIDNPDWRPEVERRLSDNDYYLAGWPSEPDKELLSDSPWQHRPVVYVNWDSANAYSIAAGCRLPSEVEWEIAARFLQPEFAPYPCGFDPTSSFSLRSRRPQGRVLPGAPTPL